MTNHTVDFTQYDTTELLTAVNLNNADTIGVELTTGDYELQTMAPAVIEPVTELVYILRNGGETEEVYNSEYSLAKYIGLTDDTVFEHLTKRIKTIVSFEEVFDSWYRYAHSWSSETQPSFEGALDTWSYDSDLNSIISGTDTQTKMHHVGMVSPNAIRNYDLDIGLSIYQPTGSGDRDDWLGIVLGFVTDADGVEHTLTALRSTGGSSQGLTDDPTKWFVNASGVINSSNAEGFWQIALVVDFRQATQKTIYRDINVREDSWYSSGGTRIHAVKNGASLAIDWYALEGPDTENIVSSKLFDLDTDDLRMFKDFVQIGYCAQSQAYGVFTNRVGGGNYVFETSAYGELVTHDGDTLKYGYRADVENEGVDTSNATVITTPSREMEIDVVYTPYPLDKVRVRYDRLALMDIMEMTIDDGDFDWYEYSEWDGTTKVVDAIAAFKAAALRQSINADKMMRNINCTRVLIDEDYYLSVTMDSYLLKGDSEGNAALFKLPHNFSEYVTTTNLADFDYTPVQLDNTNY